VSKELPSRRSIQPLIDQLKNDQVSTSELRALLDHKSILVRANTLASIARHVHQDEELVNDLVRAAIDPKNTVQLMGTITVAHEAVAALFRAGTPRAVTAGQQLLIAWPDPNRRDLLWYLQSEGLLDQQRKLIEE